MMFILPLQMTSPYSWPFSFLTWIFVSSLSNYCFHACLLSINPMYQNHNASDGSSVSYPLLHSSPAAPVGLEWIVCSAPGALPDTVQRLSLQVNASLKSFSACQTSWYLTILINIDLVYVSHIFIVRFSLISLLPLLDSVLEVMNWVLNSCRSIH